MKRLLLISVTVLMLGALPSGGTAGDESCCGFTSPGNPYLCYEDGNCVWWAWHKRPDLPGWGNPNTWLQAAANAGIPTGSSPVAGAVACFNNMYPPYGHVGYVESANPTGSFVVSEMSYGTFWSCVRTHTYAAGSASGFIYGGPVGASYVLSYTGQSPTDPSGILKFRPLETVSCWFDVQVQSGSAPISNDPNSPFYVELRSVGSNWTSASSSSLQGPGWQSWYQITKAENSANPGQTARFRFNIKTTDQLTRDPIVLRVRLFHPHSGEYVSPTGWTVSVNVLPYYNIRPNLQAPGGNEYDWKTYTVSMPSADQVVVIVNGEASTYSGSDDSDLKLVVNGQDLGWNTAKALDGATLGRDIKAITTIHNFTAGNNTIKIYADVRPTLYQVLVVPYMPLLLADVQKELPAPGGTGNYTWFTYRFYVHAQDTHTITIKGKAGYFETPSDDDDARFVLDGQDYGWNNDRALDGQNQNGGSRTITLQKSIGTGWRTLVVYADRRPRITQIRVERGTGGIAGKMEEGLDITDTEVGTDDAGEAAVIPPDRIQLTAFPNPFNPTVTLSYDVPRAAYVSLEIYDPSGRLVETLVNTQSSPGMYLVTWDASDVASGIYFARMVAAEERLTTKLILLK